MNTTISCKKPMLSQWAFIIFCAFALYALMIPFGEAMAGAKVGDMITQGTRNYRRLPTYMSYVSVVAGLVIIIIGIQKLYKSVDRPDQFPVSHGFWYLAGGTFLVSLPAAWSMMVRSMSIATKSGSTVTATNIALSTAPSSPLSLDVMMIRLVENVRGPIQLALWTLAAVLGLFFMISAFIRMAKGAGKDGPMGSVGSGTLTRILVGSMLLSFAATADVFTSTLFGGSIVKFNGMNISGVAPAALTQANQAISAIMIFIQIVGFIAFMRGFLMLRALADGNTSVSSAAAFTHIIGGAIAINISSMLAMLQNTFCDKGAGCAVMNFT